VFEQTLAARLLVYQPRQSDAAEIPFIRGHVAQTYTRFDRVLKLGWFSRHSGFQGVATAAAAVQNVSSTARQATGARRKP
jgi:hypothetical protein